jgi:predicted MFS family arabinose efflux permease
LLSIGLFITAGASKLSVFLVGRAFSGVGAGGLMITGIILTLDLVNKKRRGVFIGIVNFGMTIGVSLGAVLAGAVTPTLGWVRDLLQSTCLSNLHIATNLLGPGAGGLGSWSGSILRHSVAP